jgi:predicted TIM-barrel fold metal-dependent hydrolase
MELKMKTNDREVSDFTGLKFASLASCASRRAFLRTVGMAGAGTLLSTSGWGGQSPSTARPKGSRIDVHHHANPPVYTKTTGKFGNWNWTPAASIEQMEKYDVSTSLVSITQPGIWFGDVQQARSLARDCNEYMAQMVKDYPGRFGFFAAVPLPDQDSALREIEFGYDTLKADGIGLLTSYGDKWLGDPAFVPAFEELNRRKSIVFVHANGPNCCQNLIPGVTPTMAEFDFDTTRTVESLLVNGTLSRFPDIRFIFVHSGGTLPVLAGRLNDRFPKDRAGKVPKGVPYEVTKFYYEVAHATYPAPLAALTKFVPTSQILFGTDYPAEPMKTTIDPLAQFGLAAKDLDAINHGNAERLFPRLKA